MESINLKFKYDAEEYKEAIRMHYRSLTRIKRDTIISAILLAIGIVDLSFYGYSLIWATLVFLASLFLIMIFSAFYIVPKIAFSREPKLKDEYTMSFSEQGIKFKTDNLDSNLEWKIYNKVLEDDKFFLLYWGKYNYTVIPKRIFANHAQENNFKKMINEKILPIPIVIAKG